jgi:dihydropteroate synthase
MALSLHVMGIVNVTPDSFFAAARTEAADAATSRGRELFEVGCDVVDVGGESTRPGAEDVDVHEELARILPVVAELAAYGTVSVDTKKEAVARAAVAAGATIINDVSSTLLHVAGELEVGYVAMHAQGEPKTMQVSPTYENVVDEVTAFLEDLAARGRDLGVRPLWIDPGIGFGKTVAHNLALLASTRRLVDVAERYDAGVLVGTSRKRFLENLGEHPLSVDERLEGSIATEAWAMLEGASMVRVHDAQAAVQLRELLVRSLEDVSS